MQSYKDWVARWLGTGESYGGKLAAIVHADPKFPVGGDRKKILERLKQLNVPEDAMIAFRSGWKHYEQDVLKKPSEVSLENKLVHEVEKRGGLCWKFTSPGTAGVPDRIVIAPCGKVAFVEMKAPGGKVRPIQKKRAEQIQDIGGTYYCLKSNQDILIFLREMFDEI